MGDSPLILVLVKGILHCFGWLCTISALPALIWYSLTNIFINLHDDIKNSTSTHVVCWLPRFLFSFFMLPVWLGESVILGYFLYSGLEVVWIAVVAAVGLFIATIIGILYSQKTSPLKDLLPKIKIGKYFNTLGNGIVDFFAFICFCVNVIGVIRIPGMLASVSNLDRLKRDDITLRLQLFINFLLTFVDWVTLPFLILLPFLFPWRLPALSRRWKDATKGDAYDWLYSFSVRGWVFYQFGSGLIDVPVFLFGLLLIVVFSPWRIPTLIGKLSQTTKYKTIGQRRGVIFKQAAKGALDFLMLILSVFVFLTPYRIPILIACLFSDRMKKANHRRWHVFQLFGLVWLDMVTLLCLPLVLITVYRLPRAIEKLKLKHWKFSLWWDDPTNRDIQDPEVQFRILKTFAKVCKDLPFIFMGFFVTILLWRSFFLWRDILADPKTNSRRKNAAYHFGMLFVDIIDFPFVIMALLMFITGWRAPHLWKSISKDNSRNQIRLFVISQFGWWLLDIPTLFVALIVLLSIYRAKNLVTNLREYFKNYSDKHNPPVNAPVIDDPALAAENPKPKDLEWSWHMVVYKEMALLLLDFPFPILTVLTLWRMPWLIKGLITQAESARERRVMVLSYLWKVAKDIPCAALFLLMVVTVWRIPSIYDMYKKYQKGDDEHRTFLKLFWEWLIDVPFVIMGTLVLLWFYRFPFMIRALIKDCATDESKDRRADVERREMVAQYFGICLLDILTAVLAIWICGTLWRIPSLVERYQDRRKEWRDDNRWRHTLSFLTALVISCGLWLLDVFSMIQFVVVLAGIIHIPSFFVRAFHIICLWLEDRKPEVGLPTVHEAPHVPEISLPVSAPVDNLNQNTNQNNHTTPNGIKASVLFSEIFQFDPKEDYQVAKKRFDDEEVEGKYFSLSLLRMLLIQESIDSLRHFPHIFLIPLKLAAFVFVPLHAVMAVRLKKYSVSQRFADSPYDTLFAAPLYWISVVSIPRMNFWGMDQFFILNILGIVFVLPNEIALIPLVINSLYVFFITFGSPLWNSKREMLGWMGLGSAPGKIFGAFDAVMMVMQIIGVPIFIALQWFLLFLPLFIISIFVTYNDDDGDQDYPTAHQLFKDIFSSADYWNNHIGSLAWYWWVLFCYWVLTMFACWEITFRHLKKFYPMFDPLIAYLWLVQRVMAGTVWRIYSLFLATPTQWSYMNRRTCGCLGELLMFPIFIIWAYWPIIIPIVIPNYYVFIGAIPVCLFFTWRGYFIVKGSWKKPVDRSQLAVPKVQLTSMTVQTPESGGLLMTLVGSKPYDLTIENARLLFAGDAFWKTLNSAIPPKYVSAFKMAAYPIVLAPSFMDPTQVRASSQEFRLDLKFGTEGRYKVSKKALYKNLQKMADKEEGAFDLLIEYGTPKFGWQTQGTLIKLPNIKIGMLLTAAQDGIDLVSGGAAHLDVDVAPGIPQISGPINLRNPNHNANQNDLSTNQNDKSDSDTDVENPPLKVNTKPSLKFVEEEPKLVMPPPDQPANRKPELSTEVDMKLVQRFVEMGFDQDKVLQTLIRFNNNEEQTLNHLLSS